MKKRSNTKFSLDDIKKTNPFMVPDKYLENFPVTMAHLIVAPSKKKSFALIWDAMRPKLIPALALTGFVILLFTAITMHPFRRENKLTVTELADIYKYTAINETNETDLIKELERVSSSENIQPDTISTSSDKYSGEVIEYLKNENIDINSVIDAL